MGVRCFCCGQLTKDRVDGPTPDEVAQTERWQHAVLDVSGSDVECRAAVCCWPCFWSFDPDLWIRPSDWSSADPTVPYDSLPVYASEQHGTSDVTLFHWPL